MPLQSSLGGAFSVCLQIDFMVSLSLTILVLLPLWSRTASDPETASKHVALALCSAELCVG